MRGFSAEMINNQMREDVVYQKQSTDLLPPIQEESTPPKPSVPLQVNRQKIKNANELARVERKDEDGDFSIKHVPLELARRLQQARQAKGLSQKQLAHQTQIPLTVVRDYERGTAIANGQYTSKLRRVLGV